MTAQRRRQVAGMTLTELLFAMSISGFILGGIISTYIFCVKGFRALSNYTEIHGDGRHAIDIFVRDARMACGVQSWSTTNVVLYLPTTFDGTTGKIQSTNIVVHSFQKPYWIRTDAAVGQPVKLTGNVTGLTFSAYDQVFNTTTLASQTRGVQVDVTLRKQVLSQTQTEEMLSARVGLRNSP